MKALVFIIIAAGINSIALSQTASLQIHGPTEVVAGQLVRLNATFNEDESPFWIVLDPIDLDYEQVNHGRRLIFATNCKQTAPITILLLAQSVRDNRIVTRQVRRTIEIARAGGPPDVKPPDDEPAPVDDFNKSPLFAIVLSAWKKITVQEAIQKTDLVAANFEKTAQECESGVVGETKEIWKRLSLLNRASLGSLVTQWEPVGLAVQQGFQDLILSSIEEHAFHLRAIAVALRRSQQ